jgi:CheY-like chemotaxis protein
VLRDSTERKHFEEELQRRADALEDADRRKDEFLAMLGHELRNHLAAIFNALHILARVSEDPLVSQAQGMLDRQVRQLARLVDDLLDVSRITRGKLQLQKSLVEFKAVVAPAVQTARPLLDARRQELVVGLPEEPLWLEADPGRLAQVVTNLLHNAAKYSDEGGRVTLTARREGHQCVLRVRDQGVGIAPDLLPRVFDLFTQAERSLDRAQGGLGIGLALVKRLVELHGGAVEAHSGGPGQGSEFVVRLPLPLGVEGGTPTPTAQGAARAERPLRVLVVEDNADAAATLGVLLRLYGHEAQVAPCGPTALEMAAAFRPEVVLLDIGLPGLDGFQVAQRLRERPDTKEVVLVAMTGYGQESDRRRAREAGFDHFLVKPVDPAELERLLAERARPGGAAGK